MKRSGPYFAMLPPCPKTGEQKPSLQPRKKQPNPIPKESGIIDKLKRSQKTERQILAQQAKSYADASPRTKRKILALS